MKFSGFSSGCIGKALLIICCLLLGVVLAIGGEALAGYLILTQDGMVGKIADTVNPVEGEGEPILNFTEEVKSMSVLEWGSEILGAVGDLSNNEIGTIESLIGISIISDTVSDMLGLDPEVVKGSTLENVGETISTNLTLNNAVDKFGIELPADMPLFSNEEFLNSPLATAFEDITKYTIGDFIDIGAESNAVLAEMSSIAISDLGGSTADEKIKSMFLCQIMNIDDTSEDILQSLKYCCIESQWTDDTHTAYKTKTITEIVDGVEVENTYELIGINEKINDLKFGDVIEVTDESEPILITLKDKKINEINDVMSEIKIGEVVDITDDSNIILKKMKELGVSELGGAKVTEIINGTLLEELIEIDNNSNIILQKMAELTVGELGGEKVNQIIDGTLIAELVEITDDSNVILRKMKLQELTVSQLGGSAVNDIVNSTKIGEIITIGIDSEPIMQVLKDTEIQNLNAKVATLKISDVVKIDTSSHIILQKMATYDGNGLLVKELGGLKVTAIVNDTKIGELIAIDITSEPIMQALKDTKIGELNTRMGEITISDIFKEEDIKTGALSLIPADTTITNIPSAVTDVMQSATTATMIGNGLIDSDLTALDEAGFDDKKDQKAFILNSNVGEMMQGVVNFIETPLIQTEPGNPLTIAPNYGLIAPRHDPVSATSFSSLTDFVAAYSQYNTVEFANSVTVTVDADLDAQFYNAESGEYNIPVFNGIADAEVTLTFSETVKLAVYEETATGYGDRTKSQCAYCYFTNVSFNGLANDQVGASAKIGEITTTAMKG